MATASTSALPALPHQKSAYDRLAGIYDLLGHLYTSGGIARAKRAHVRLFHPQMRVLYVGAGTGGECVHAARAGARLTIVDQSAAMLRRCAQRLRGAGERARLIRADARHLGTFEPFDAVVAPFFLNLFEKGEVRQLVSSLCETVSDGGLFISVDFRAPSKNRLFSTLQRAYYLPPLALFRLATENAWHELYDYQAIAKDCAGSLTLEDRLVHRAYGLPLLETLVWRVR